jgi:C4-dicarboxylate-specific signal transduction histidine kinase
MVIFAVFLVNVAGNRFFLQKKIVRSLKPIVDGIGSIRMGDYSSRIEVTQYADVNLLIGLINDMAASILAKKSELVEANTLLENRVEERTGELLQSLAELRQAQDRLVESGKLSALGLLAAGMAHELNTPLGAILSSNRTIMDFFDAKINDLYDFFTSMNNNELALYTRAMELGAQSSRTLDTPELSRAQLRDIRAMLAEAGVQDSRVVAEYLAEMGIPPDDNVMQSLLSEPRASHILKYASDLLATRRMAEIVDVAGKKAAAVVSALRFYLSPDSADMEGVVSLEDDIEQILTLMHNMLKHGITVRREFSGVKTRGSSEKLGQVWMNIIRNAAQAMDFKGDLKIKTEASASRAIVSFIDSGPGIPDAVVPHIFEPFFTTKQHGEGMGLGLDICRRIIEAHGGTIEVETRPGQTAFRIILPLI